MVAAPCSMSDRARLRADFVARAGWADARESLLAGDASFRKYFRLTRANGPHAAMHIERYEFKTRGFNGL